MERKILCTYQPKKVKDRLAKEDYCVGEKNHFVAYDGLARSLGFNPIFAFEFKDLREFLINSLISFPTLPQELIFFEADDYKEIDFLTWSRALKTGDFSSLFDVRLPVVYVPSIVKSNVKTTVSVSGRFGFGASDDYIEKLTGNLKDSIVEELEKVDFSVKDKVVVKRVENLPVEVRKHLLSGLDGLFLFPEKMSQAGLDRLIGLVSNYIFIKG
jgi:hypothetical protein